MPLPHYRLSLPARQAVASIAIFARSSLDFLGVIVALRLDGFPGIFAYPLLCSRGNGFLQLYVHLFRRLRRRYHHCITIELSEFMSLDFQRGVLE